MQKVEREAEERDAAAAAAGGAAASLDALDKRQIFDTRSAFRRLTNELEEIFRLQDYNLMADADGPQGLFHWDVSLAGFRADSPLAEDMRQAGRAFGLSSVQLQLTFKRGLHPFYPPAVRLVSPRFGPGVLAAVEAHPLLKADAWDPTLSAAELLQHVKAFLEDNARVELGSERNRGEGARASSYLEAEHLLARLQALTGVPAAVPQGHAGAFKYGDLPARGAASPVQKKQKAAAGAAAGPGVRQAAAWKAGVGFGHSGSGRDDGVTVWDVRRAEAVQAARDADACAALGGLAVEVRRCLAQPPQSHDHADVLPALRRGCLAPLLIRELSAASFQDMSARHGYFRALLECADALCAAPSAADVVAWRAEGGGKSVADAVAAAHTQAAHFLRVYAQTQGQGQGQQPGGSGPPARPPATTGQGMAAAADDDSAELALAELLVAVAAKTAAAAAAAEAAARPAPAAAARTRGGRAAAAAAAAAAAGSAPSSAAAAAPVGEEARYEAAMRDFRVRIVSGVAANHRFVDQARREPTAPAKPRARRVGRELASLESDLPITCSSSVFVVADEANSVLWKAIITGPQGTPYAGGCFLFDIYFGPDYPARPPQVVIRTTGGGSVRFNPNLYNEGKVCLSLLGTWSGGKGETWSAEYSTILQVLVSIQSLILVDEPWYNEPGVEQHADSSSSDRYNAEVMENAVRWAMVDQLRSPPEYFADCIRAHFRERGAEVLRTARGWAAWCREKGHPCRGDAIDKMLPELTTLLNALQP
jgi:baculoviral IAP repeat-containing protein 6